MSTVMQSIAKGAVWMVLFKALERSIGLISTLILARLLMPEDFGLIAMAMSLVAIVELLWTFGFDSALIQNRNADRTHYDTAWTLNALLGFTIAVGLLLLAHPTAWLYGDPRLVPLVYCLAVGAVFQGLENIGVVAFRKDLRFGMEFGYQISKKIAGFLVTVPLAFALQNYWALAAGIVAGRIASVIISYVAHPYRPRISLQARSTLFGFSKWLFLNNLLFALQMRSQDFVIGKIAGPTGLGLYTVAYEISTLPTSEIVNPINRAVFPGFAQLAQDPSALVRGYLRVFGMIALLSLPAGVGLAATADLIVPTILGAKWLAVIPIVKILALYGAVASLGSVFGPTFLALGRPRMLALFTTINVALFVPAVSYGTINHGILGAASACLMVVLFMVPLSHWIAARALEVPLLKVLAHVWRPAVSALVMFIGVTTAVDALAGQESLLSLAASLLIAVVTGVVIYAASVATLWFFSHRPRSAEADILSEIRKRITRKTRS